MRTRRGSPIPRTACFEAYFEANVARFAEAPSISFSQVYFNAESRRDAAADAAAAISLLNAGAKEDEVGDRFLLGSQTARADRQAVSNMFGDEFADIVLEIEPGKWSGPIKSGYGMHVVLVTGREASDPPAFDMVRDRVLAEWRRDNEKKVARTTLLGFAKNMASSSTSMSSRCSSRDRKSMFH